MRNCNWKNKKATNNRKKNWNTQDTQSKRTHTPRICLLICFLFFVARATMQVEDANAASRFFFKNFYFCLFRIILSRSSLLRVCVWYEKMCWNWIFYLVRTNQTKLFSTSSHLCDILIYGVGEFKTVQWIYFADWSHSMHFVNELDFYILFDWFIKM